MAYADDDLGNVVLTGKQVTINTTTDLSPQVGLNIDAHNYTTVGQYGATFLNYVKHGALDNFQNDCAETAITRWEDIPYGNAWGKWEVTTSPLPYGSGLPTAPANVQGFGMISREINPQNRTQSTGFVPESRLNNNWVGGYQFVAETQDFTGLLGNVRPGHDLYFATSVSHSPFTSTMPGGHAQWNCGHLISPNAIAPGGYGYFMTAYRPFVTGVTIASGGSGYAPGDVLTFNSGLDQTKNWDAQVRVLTVNGSGALATIDFIFAGSYQTTPSGPMSVTGGSGSGATLNFTMSSASAERPKSAFFVGGEIESVIDGCHDTAGHLKVTRALIRSSHNQPIIAARNAANTDDVALLRSNASDRLELVGREVITPTNYTPTFSAEDGTISSCTVTSARYSKINGRVSFDVTFTPTAGSSVILRMGVPTTAAENATLIGFGHSDGKSFIGTVTTGNGYARLLGVDASATQFQGGQYYTFSGSYEVA